MNSIQFPTQTTFYIAYTEGDYSFGSVTPEQEMVTPHTSLWTTLDELEWVLKLETEYGVSPYVKPSNIDY